VGKLTVQDYMKRNPALKRIAEMLEDAFNSVGEKIRGDLLKAYRKYAKDAYDSFIHAIETEHGEIPRNRFGRQRYADWYRFADYAGGSYKPFRSWEDMRAVLENFSLTYKYADQDANLAYEHARDSFVYKNLGKMDEVLGKRQDLKNAVLRFDWRNGAFEGNIQVYLEGASYFRGAVSIKYVIRTTPRVTPYFQYPLVFTEAEIGGKYYARPSEEELRNLLSGKSSEQHRTEKAAEAVAAGYCPMSGKSVPSGTKGPGRYKTCPSCGQIFVPTSNWFFPKHKTKEAIKKEVGAKLTQAGYCPMSRQKVPVEIVAAMGPVEPYKDPKAPCPTCKQQVRLDARKEWIRDQFLTPDGYSTKMKVESATYYKHKLTK
jgi:hypothetical protein